MTASLPLLIKSMWSSGGNDIMRNKWVCLSWCWKSRSLMRRSSSSCMRQQLWQTQCYYGQHPSSSQSVPVRNWETTALFVNRLQIQHSPEFQPTPSMQMVTARLTRHVRAPEGLYHSPWTASPAVCGLLSWAWGCCWHNRGAARQAPRSLCTWWPPSEHRGWKHTAPVARQGVRNYTS